MSRHRETLEHDKFYSDRGGVTLVQELPAISAAVLKQKGFIAGTNVSAVSGTSETPFFLLTNPAGSGKHLRIFRGVFGSDSSASRSTFRLYANPTLTANGTAYPIYNLVQGSSSTSVALAYYLPTTSSNGALRTVRVVPPEHPTFVLEIDHFYVLLEGQSLLITVQNTQNNTPSHTGLLWVEE